MTVIINEGLEDVLEFMDFANREAPARGVHGNLMGKQWGGSVQDHQLDGSYVSKIRTK